MKNLSAGEVQRTSEVFGNIAVAWFSAGAISPLFSNSQNSLDLSVIFRSFVAISISGFFFLVSLRLARKAHK